MKYNAKYDRWVSKDGLVYRYDKKNDKLVLCSEFKTDKGYIRVYTKAGFKFTHRVVYETFNGEIPDGFEIDHINTIRDDNKLENLICVTPKDNRNNTLTIEHMKVARKGNTAKKEKATSEFGKKYKEHFGTIDSTSKQYIAEYIFYRRHNKVCRWEVEQ